MRDTGGYIMKTQSPLLMGFIIFGANLLMQAVSTGSADVDVFRALAIAILCALGYFIVLPLLGSNNPGIESRVPVRHSEPVPRQESRLD